MTDYEWSQLRLQRASFLAYLVLSSVNRNESVLGRRWSVGYDGMTVYAYRPHEFWLTYSDLFLAALLIKKTWGPK